MFQAAGEDQGHAEEIISWLAWVSCRLGVPLEELVEVRGEEYLDLPAQTVAPATRTWISVRKRNEMRWSLSQMGPRRELGASWSVTPATEAHSIAKGYMGQP